ncbi:MAG: TMEM14 family protein [Anaerolineales bacterium]|nr:TMEM14 family protein [Anaerolineales bacterium]MCB9127227.1 TMEM14 family protein [Ardenticatenales bacterium]MCB9171983.1 TMEM14 family protein [Ardenticatenales bacterium]
MQKIAQLFLPLYGLVLLFGGFKGYQEGSDESLYIGGGSGVATLLLTALSLKRPRLSLALASLIALVLTGVMGWRFEKTGKLVPPGLIATTSLLATGIEALGAWKATEGE